MSRLLSREEVGCKLESLWAADEAGRKLAHWVDRLQGGRADGKSPSDFNPAQLAKGVGIEKEHTSNPTLAKEISMDHLVEDPNYYKKLPVMEEAELGDILELAKKAGVIFAGMDKEAFGIVDTRNALRGIYHAPGKVMNFLKGVGSKPAAFKPKLTPFKETANMLGEPALARHVPIAKAPVKDPMLENLGKPEPKWKQMQNARNAAPAPKAPVAPASTAEAEAQFFGKQQLPAEGGAPKPKYKHVSPIEEQRARESLGNALRNNPEAMRAAGFNYPGPHEIDFKHLTSTGPKHTPIAPHAQAPGRVVPNEAPVPATAPAAQVPVAPARQAVPNAALPAQAPVTPARQGAVPEVPVAPAGQLAPNPAAAGAAPAAAQAPGQVVPRKGGITPGQIAAYGLAGLVPYAGYKGIQAAPDAVRGLDTYLSSPTSFGGEQGVAEGFSPTYVGYGNSPYGPGIANMGVGG